MSSIGTDCIYERERPDLSEVPDSALTQILLAHDYEWINPDRTRVEMIKKIFEIWSEQEILDQTNSPIMCTICLENMTNGDNMILPCGHQTHSKCMLKGVLIRCADMFVSGLKDKDSQQIELDYTCTQCNVRMDSYILDKNIFSESNE